VIEPDGVKIDKKKVQRVVDWLMLRSMRDIQKFLGLENYYKYFVNDFARAAKPLHGMTVMECFGH